MVGIKGCGDTGETEGCGCNGRKDVMDGTQIWMPKLYTGVPQQQIQQQQRPSCIHSAIDSDDMRCVTLRCSNIYE